MLNLVADCCKLLKFNQSEPGRGTGSFFYCQNSIFSLAHIGGIDQTARICTFLFALDILKQVFSCRGSYCPCFHNHILKSLLITFQLPLKFVRRQIKMMRMHFILFLLRRFEFPNPSEIKIMKNAIPSLQHVSYSI